MARASAAAEATVTKGLSPEEVDDLRDSFSNFDKNGDGSIDKAELAVILRSLGYSPTTEQLMKLMNKVNWRERLATHDLRSMFPYTGKCGTQTTKTSWRNSQSLSVVK